MEEYIKKHAEFITAFSGALTVLVLFWKNIKNFIVKRYKERQEYLKNRNDIPITLNDIKNKLVVMDTRLQDVEKEIKPNGGGSMKDVLKIVQAEIEASFWLNPSPSFRTTSNGSNIIVNESYCHLCGVSSESLLKLGWRNFVCDEEQLEYFTDQWKESASEYSQFSGKLKFQNYKNEYRGEWIVKIRPLGVITINGKNDFLWHGVLSPSDSVAITYAAKENIPV